MNKLLSDAFSRNYEKAKCRVCGKTVDKLDLFSGDLCVDCYEKKFDQMSGEEKVPVFGGNLIK